MKSRLQIVKDFVSKLKKLETNGQGCGYPFWYLYDDEFRHLDSLISDYEEIVKVINCGTRDQY